MAGCEDKKLQAYPNELAGVGVVVQSTDQGHTIASIIPGGPAAAAGLSVGDRIVAVDGSPTGGRPLASVVNALRGREGSEVVLKVASAKGDSIVTLQRKLLARNGDGYKPQ